MQTADLQVPIDNCHLAAWPLPHAFPVSSGRPRLVIARTETSLAGNKHRRRRSLLHDQPSTAAIHGGNSRSISLLSAAGKVLARVMLRRFLTNVVDAVVPESQCGFRRQWRIDMIFVVFENTHRLNDKLIK